MLLRKKNRNFRYAILSKDEGDVQFRRHLGKSCRRASAVGQKRTSSDTKILSVNWLSIANFGAVPNSLHDESGIACQAYKTRSEHQSDAGTAFSTSETRPAQANNKQSNANARRQS
jgi:hypothetical protein